MSSINRISSSHNYYYNEVSTSEGSSSSSTTSSSAAALLSSAPLCTTSSSAAALSSSTNPISSSSNAKALVVNAKSLTGAIPRGSSSIEDMSQILLSDYALNIVAECSHHTLKAVEKLIEIAKSTKNPRILSKLQSLVEKFNESDSLNENSWDFCNGKGQLRPKINQLLQILSDKDGEKRTRTLAAATSSSAYAALISQENSSEISERKQVPHEVDEDLLNSIQKGNEPKINLKNVCNIFDVAEYLDRGDLKDKCIEFCKKLELSVDNIEKMIDIAAYLDMDEQFKRCDLFCAEQTELSDFNPGVVREIKSRASKFPNSLKTVDYLLKKLEKEILGGNEPKINLENVCNVFDIAEYLDRGDLKDKCIEFCKKLELSVDNIEKMIDIAAYLDMDEQFDRYDTFCAQQLHWNYNLTHKIIVSTSQKFPKSFEALKDWRNKTREKFENEKIKGVLRDFQVGGDPEISLENVCDVFDIAKYLNDQDLKDKCMEFCKTLEPTRKNIDKMIDIAEYLDADELFKRCDLFWAGNAYLTDFKPEIVRKIKSRASKFPNALKTINYFFKQMETDLQDGAYGLPHKEYLILLKEAGANIKKLHLPHADQQDFKTIVEVFPDLESLTVCYQPGNSTYLNITPDIAPHLAKLKSLKHLCLTWSCCPDNIGPCLAELESLESLDLSWSDYSDNIVPYLSNLTSLKRLNLTSNKIQSSVIAPALAQLKSLESLDLSCSRSRDDIGPSLAQLKSLKHLNLSRSLVTDAIGRHLEELTSLESLDLSNNELLTDDIGPSLAQLKSLKSLDLSNNKLLTDDIGLSLAELKSLEHLNLSNIKLLTDDIGFYLTSLHSLKSLDLSNNKLLTDDIGPYLAKLKSLEHLNLSLIELLTDFFGFYLTSLPSLKSLILNFSKKLTSTIGLHLQKLKSLESLDLSNNKLLTDDIGPSLAKLKSLKHLNLAGNSVTDAIGRHLEELTSLKSLILSCNDLLTDDIGPSLAQLKSLEHLDFMFCDQVTAEICPDLKNLVSLTSLHLRQAETYELLMHVERLRNGLLPVRKDPRRR